METAVRPPRFGYPATLKARIETLEAELARLEAAAAVRQADFEREHLLRQLVPGANMRALLSDGPTAALSRCEMGRGQGPDLFMTGVIVGARGTNKMPIYSSLFPFSP
jgi:hypothetical protein